MSNHNFPPSTANPYGVEQKLVLQNFLERAQAGLFDTPYPNYPSVRYTMKDMAVENPTIPDGPWSTGEFELPHPEEHAHFALLGLAIDDLGRPLHPWLPYMLGNEKIGAVSGRGFYWNWGPNYTADPVVITKETRPRVLLIIRGDTGTPALPGGFVNKAEHPLDAAARELEEETGLILPASEGIEIYRGIVADKRTTAHAWAETTGVVWFVDKPTPVHGADDAILAEWFHIDSLPDSFFGSHSILVYAGLQRM